MSERKKALEEILVSHLLRLDAAVVALVSGMLFGGGLFIATNWLVLKGGPAVGAHLRLLGQFFIGYRVTFAGSFVGLAYGFVLGSLGGYVVAILYNSFVSLRERPSTSGSDRSSR